MELALGSLMDVHEPHDTYRDSSGYMISEWRFEGNDAFTSVHIYKRKFLTMRERVENAIDKFDEYFPEKVIDDSKRINFDLPDTQGKNPNRTAVLCLSIAANLHGFEIDNYTLSRYIKQKFEKTWFGDSVVVARRLLHGVDKDREEFLKRVGQKKIAILKKMWCKLDG